MSRTRHKRSALLFLLLIALLIAVPLVLTWRVVQQERLNQALITAVKRNDDQAVVSLLDQGADVNCREKPADWISSWQMLLDLLQGKRVKARIAAMTPLAYAVGGNDMLDENTTLVRDLLDHGAYIDAPAGEQKQTPLAYSVSRHHDDTAIILLAYGAKVSDADSAELICSAYPDMSLMADLLWHGANVNARLTNLQEFHDRTPLMEFSRSADLPPVDLLLAHHADVNLKDKDGKTALDLAYKSDPGITPRQVFERHEVIRLLKAAEAKR